MHQTMCLKRVEKKNLLGRYKQGCKKNKERNTKAAV